MEFRLLSIKLSITIFKIDRWLSNHIFNRSRVLTVKLSSCVDEFGNSYGKDGSHFFIHALNKDERFDSISNFLIKSYDKNKKLSFNQEADCDIGSIEGHQYFCPWEKNRIRPLKKFISSPKIGPTDKKSIPIIVTRLLNVLDIIRLKKLPIWLLLDGYPRLIKIVDKNYKELYLIRAGNHRSSVYSYLGFESIKATYEADHWKPSKFLLWFYKLLKNQDYLYPKHLRIINELEVDSWPHVQSGLVSQKHALKVFHNRFDNAFKKTLKNTNQ